jgi:predicted DNA-binding WGR domain protein
MEQTVLEFREGTSDKIYEVDLCEAGSGEYLVNFRYGRRGARLQEGTKTVFPEPLERARSIYQNLINEKLRKGYWVQGTVAEAEIPAPVKKSTPKSLNPQARKGVQKHLQAALRDEWEESRKLSRLIWRAGQLKMTESLKTLIKLPELDYFDEYSLAWSLGRIGTEDALPRLSQLMNASTPAVRRIATEAYLLCLPDEKRPEFWHKLNLVIPDDWLAELDDSQMNERAVAIVRNQKMQTDDETLYHLYLYGVVEPKARELAWWIMRHVPLAKPWRKSIRAIYKAAELRVDGEMYGLCSRRFEIAMGQFSGGVSLSSRSMRYFTRRQRRLFLQAAKDGDVAIFITLAVGVLLAYDDTEQCKPFQVSSFKQVGRSYQQVITHYDDNARWLGLNVLLYQNSPRYLAGTRAWRCKEPYLPGAAAPAEREEFQPAFWDQAPDAIKHLLTASPCGRVLEFARKVWLANPSFQQTVDLIFAGKLLTSRYQENQALGLSLAKLWMDPQSPDAGLLVSLCRCELDEARLMGLHLLATHPECFARLEEVSLPLLLTPHPQMQECLQQWLPNALGKEQRSAFLALVIPHLLVCKAGQEAIASAAVETLCIVCGDCLAEVDDAVVARLLEYPLPALPLLASRILLVKPIEQLSEKLLQGLSHSPHPDVRAEGMKLWNRMSDEQLVEHAATIADFCLSPLPEVRQGVIPMVRRLAEKDAAFAEIIVVRLYPRLLRAEDHPGIHEDIFEILVGPLRAYLELIELGHRLRMLDMPYRHSQLLGLHFLKQHIDLRDVSMERIIKLGSAQTREVREFVWETMRQQVARVKHEREASLRLLDSDWDDSRAFAREYFTEHFSEAEWTPDLLVSLCDSIRPDVQDFGKQMITRYFQEKDGEVYLQKLSQHPSSHLQLFASNYLERFASGNLSRLQTMEWFFLSVLSRVNQGRVVKQRVLQMIRHEVARSEETASWFMPLLARQSLTVAIEEKAAILKILQEIHQLWPHIPSPLQVKEIPVRRSWESPTRT